MPTPEFIIMVHDDVAESAKVSPAAFTIWAQRGWELADPADEQWLAEPAPADPVNVITAPELAEAIAGLSGTYASRTSLQGAVSGLDFSMASTSETVAGGSDVYPVGALNGIAYGTTDAGDMYITPDEGETWTLLNGNAGFFQGIYAAGDGEILLNNGASILRSTGWSSNQATATFATVLTANGDSYFLPSNLDTFGQYAIAAEYAIPRTDARFVYVSSDNGATWTQRRDLNAMHPGHEDGTHWHSVCIDDYDTGTPRMWASHGDNPYAAVLYSDNAGVSWTVYESGWQPMPMMATQAGIVTSTDQNNPDGVWLIPRDLSERVMLASIPAATWADSLLGFGIGAVRDETTGIVYITFRGEQQVHFTAPVPSYIFATDGVTANIIYETKQVGVVGEAASLNFGGTPAITTAGTLLATYTDTDDVRHVIRGRASRGSAPLARKDFTNALGGVTLDRSSIALGFGTVGDRRSFVAGSLASRKDPTDYNVVVIGELGSVGDHGTGVGYGIDVDDFGVGVGDDSTAGAEGVVVGSSSTAGANGVTIGRSSSGGAGSVSIGRQVDATGPGSIAIVAHPFSDPTATNAVLIGALKATSDGAVAIGDYQTEATGAFGAVAIGSLAKATGGQSLAFASSTAGHFQAVTFPGATSAADYDFHIGARRMIITETGDPGNAPANSVYFYSRDNGSGKTQIVARYATGAAEVIHTQA